MKLFDYIYDNITDIHKLKTELPALFGAAYMTIMTYFDFDIFTESVRPVLIPFCMAIGWILSTALIFAKLRLLFIDFKIKKLDQKNKTREVSINEQLDKIKKEQAISEHKAIQEFYKKLNDSKAENKEELEKNLQELTDITNKNHDDYIKTIKNG